jgi:anti-sigma regulatory factor (Ser/Thr protein kinase)
MTPILVRSVTRSKNVIRFTDRVNDKAVRDFVPALYEAINRGFTDLVLDFRATTRAYADAIVPIICLVEHRRRRGNSFKVLLPDSVTLRQLFLNANWAHFLDAEHPKVDMSHPQHLALRRYTTHTEQQDAVNAALDVAMRNMDLRRDVISALEWSLNEITDNVLNHSQAEHGGLVQVSTFRDEHKIKFFVGDGGRGVPAAMREAFPDLRNDVQALEEAMKRGVTSIPDSGQGNGLAGSLRIATYAEGSFKISSGKGQIAVFRDARSGEYRPKKARFPGEMRFPGTLVMVELQTDADFAIEEALALDGTPRVPTADIVDTQYTGAGDDLVLQIKDESIGFGTRHAGVELRTKCRNLLNADPEKRLVLDWCGVPVISSSFADEALGKLFIELGPMEFSTRLRNVGAEPLVRSLIDRAIMQRVAQAAGDGGSHPTAPA